MIGYVIQIKTLISTAEAGAITFQYVAPMVLGIISAKKSIANVSMTETITTASLPNTIAA
jgi:hypothetical protein